MVRMKYGWISSGWWWCMNAGLSVETCVSLWKGCWGLGKLCKEGWECTGVVKNKVCLKSLKWT